MRVVFVCVLLVASVLCQTIPKNVPGSCDGDGNGAVGCGFDLSKLDVMGAAITPQYQVIQMQWCPDECYTPEHRWDPDCEYCEFSLPGYSNMSYRVPSNLMLLPETMSGGCYEQHTSSAMEDYEEMVGHSEGGGGWFSSWSKVTEKFYGMYYETDSSLSLQTHNTIWYSISMPMFGSQPVFNQEFSAMISFLPDEYDYKTYMGVIDQFGTHVMTSAFMGGSSLLTSYFHSCLLEQFGGTYVFEQSSSSFFGLFSHGSKNNHGFNNTDSKFKTWSQVNGTLIGGAADRYGTLNWTHTMTETEYQGWVDSIKFDMAPISYTLTPLYKLVSDPVKAANLNRTMVEYGVTIKDYNVNVANKLRPNDPYKKPSWCKFSPHPPPTLKKDSYQNIESSLPSCPSLPSTEDVEGLLRARKERTPRFPERS